MKKTKNLTFLEVLDFFKENPEGVLTPGRSRDDLVKYEYNIGRIKVNIHAEIVGSDKVEIWTKDQTDLIFILYVEDFMAARSEDISLGKKLLLAFSDGELMEIWVK